MAMTVSQMAHRAAKRGVKRAAFIERVRYWTREGLLETVGEHHPGTGRHRRYDELALEDALALNALPISASRWASYALPALTLRMYYTEWRSASAHASSWQSVMLPNGKLLRRIFTKRATPMMADWQTAPSFSI